MECKEVQRNITAFLNGELSGRTAENFLKHIEECFKKAAKMFVKKVDGKTIKPEIIWKTELKYPLLNKSDILIIY